MYPLTNPPAPLAAPRPRPPTYLPEAPPEALVGGANNPPLGPVDQVVANAAAHTSTARVNHVYSPALPLPAPSRPSSPANLNCGGLVGHAIFLLGRVPDEQLVSNLLPQLSTSAGGELAQFASHSTHASHLAVWTAEAAMRQLWQTAKAASEASVLSPPDANAHVERLQQIHGKYKAFYLAVAPDLFAQTGVHALHNGQLDNAATWSRRALRLGAGPLPAAAVLAQVQIGRKEYAEAEHVLRVAVHLAPGDAALHVMLGAARLQLHQAPAALAALCVAVDLAPNDAVAHTYLGNALTALGYYQRAMGHYVHAITQQYGLAEAQLNLETVRSYLEMKGAEADAVATDPVTASRCAV